MSASLESLSSFSLDSTFTVFDFEVVVGLDLMLDLVERDGLGFGGSDCSFLIGISSDWLPSFKFSLSSFLGSTTFCAF